MYFTLSQSIQLYICLGDISGIWNLLRVPFVYAMSSESARALEQAAQEIILNNQKKQRLDLT